MPNQQIRTPRFYPDLINYHRARGSTIGTVAATNAGTYKIGVQSGSADELFDLRPLNQVTFDTSADTDGHVLVNLIFDTASYKQSYVAILNHNLKSAVGKIRIFAGDEAADITAVDGANAEAADINWATHVDAGNVNEITNADKITKGAGSSQAEGTYSVVIEPSIDGTTVITFPEQDLRYWGIQFEGNTSNTGAAINGTWGSTDLAVGGIMIGEFFDMPHAPDMAVKKSIIYDHVDIQESLGGQRYSNATSFGRTASATSKSPFTLGASGQATYGGRQAYDLNFSYLDSTDLIPAESSIYNFTDDTVISDVWNMVDGPARPFIFSIDNTSGIVDSGSDLDEALTTSETAIDVDDSTDFEVGDIIYINSESMLVTSMITNVLTVTRGYFGTTATTHSNNDSIFIKKSSESAHMFARFGQQSLDMTQVSNDIFNVSMRIEEEF